jgi:hypothetical protein
MQDCGCDSDIVKDEMHERASVLPGPYMYIDISHRPSRVHACTIAIRTQDIVFLFDVDLQDWDISTYDVSYLLRRRPIGQSTHAHPRKFLIYRTSIPYYCIDRHHQNHSEKTGYRLVVRRRYSR